MTSESDDVGAGRAMAEAVEPYRVIAIARQRVGEPLLKTEMREIEAFVQQTATLRAKLTEAMRFHANEHADRLRAEAECDAATARAAEAERLLRGIVEADDREIALMAQPVREGRETDMNRAACARMHAIDAARQSLKAKEPTDGE